MAEGQSVVRQEDVFKGKTQLKNPFGLRDPFKSPFVKMKTKDQKGKALLRDGVFTNVPIISDETPISSIKLVGVLVGKERRAIVKMPNGKATFILKEGMKLGQDRAELKAILPGGIIFVEKIVNVYGHDEYLETVIPLTKE